MSTVALIVELTVASEPGSVSVEGLDANPVGSVRRRASSDR